jgi:nucleoside-diphosphate-sugar epimerase
MILVAGAGGYVGRRIVKRLRDSGDSVRCLVRETTDPDGLGACSQRAVADLESPLPPSLFQDADAVVSAAHIRFAPNLVRAGLAAGVRRFVLFSSTWRFSNVVTSTTESVVKGEDETAELEADLTYLRPTMIYGPGDDRNISRIRSHMSRSRMIPIFGSGECLVQPVYVDDVADAAIQALRRAVAIGKAYTIAGPSPMAYTDMVDAIARRLGRTVVKVYVPLFAAVPIVKLYESMSSNPRVSVDQVRRMSEDRAFGIEETLQELGFEPRGFEEGLRDCDR